MIDKIFSTYLILAVVIICFCQTAGDNTTKTPALIGGATIASAFFIIPIYLIYKVWA